MKGKYCVDPVTLKKSYQTSHVLKNILQSLMEIYPRPKEKVTTRHEDRQTLCFTPYTKHKNEPKIRPSFSLACHIRPYYVLGHRGQRPTGGPLLQETSSSDRKGTATNRMRSNDLEACWKKCCYFWVHFEVKFWRVFDVFFDLVKFALFDAISKDLYWAKCLIYIYFVYFSCLQIEECLLKIKNFSEFLMNIFRSRKCGGRGWMHAFEFEQMSSLYNWTAWWIHISFWYLGQIYRGWIQGGAKIVHVGSLLKKTSSSDRKATATNQMQNNNLEACWNKCCCFWLHLEVKFLTHFDICLDLVMLVSFIAIYIDFYSVKCFICIYFCSFHVYKWEIGLYIRCICFENLNDIFAFI